VAASVLRPKPEMPSLPTSEDKKGLQTVSPETLVCLVKRMCQSSNLLIDDLNEIFAFENYRI